MFSGLRPAIYILRVVAGDEYSDISSVVITRVLEITNDRERCTMHLINGGVTVTGDSATVEFTGRGPVKGYMCQLDKQETFECKTCLHLMALTFSLYTCTILRLGSNPIELSGLSAGEHLLEVDPFGCGQSLKTEINIV